MNHTRHGRGGGAKQAGRSMGSHVARDGIVYDPAKLYEDAKGKL